MELVLSGTAAESIGAPFAKGNRLPEAAREPTRGFQLTLSGRRGEPEQLVDHAVSQERF
jgi:hypothetical protein